VALLTSAARPPALVSGQVVAFANTHQGERMGNGRPYDSARFTVAVVSQAFAPGTWVRVRNPHTRQAAYGQVTSQLRHTYHLVAQVSRAVAHEVGLRGQQPIHLELAEVHASQVPARFFDRSRFGVDLPGPATSTVYPGQAQPEEVAHRYQLFRFSGEGQTPHGYGLQLANLPNLEQAQTFAAQPWVAQLGLVYYWPVLAKGKLQHRVMYGQFASPAEAKKAAAQLARQYRPAAKAPVLAYPEPVRLGD
jgi:hypothetical protein